MTKIKNILAILFCTLFITGCFERQADIKNLSVYEKDKLTFNYPSNWKVTEDTSDENARFIIIETSGDAITKIEIYDKELFTLKEFVDLHTKAFENNMPKVVNFIGNTVEKIETTINEMSFDGYKFDFNIKIIGINVPHTATYHMKSSTEKTAYIVSQVVNEDSKKVNNGFNIILSSFKFSH